MQQENWSSAQLELLEEATALVEAAPTVEQALTSLAQLLTARERRFGWVGFYLLRNGTLEMAARSGHDRPTHPPSVAYGMGPHGLAAMRAATVALLDLRSDPRGLACTSTSHWEIIVPIQEEGTVYGEIDVDGKGSRKPARNDRSFLETVAAHVASIFHPGERRRQP